jgi:hypothetical protein
MKPAIQSLDPNIRHHMDTESKPLPEDAHTRGARDLLACLEPRDLAICVSFLQQFVSEGDLHKPGEVHERNTRPTGLTDGTKRRFEKILGRLVGEREGPSRCEVAFIRQVWHEYRGDWEQAVGSPVPTSVDKSAAAGEIE